MADRDFFQGGFEYAPGKTAVRVLLVSFKHHPNTDGTDVIVIVQQGVDLGSCLTQQRVCMPTGHPFYLGKK
ncbi:hypothetical protein [Spongorhabdus nitratireducens]